MKVSEEAKRYSEQMPSDSDTEKTRIQLAFKMGAFWLYSELQSTTKDPEGDIIGFMEDVENDRKLWFDLMEERIKND